MLGLIGASCHQTEEGSTDGETHFLKACETQCDGDQGLTCVCGVCTLPCGDGQGCQELSSSAQCLPVAARSESAACPHSSPAAFCDLLCTTDQSCSHFSPSYRCLGGFCRPAVGSSRADPDASRAVDGAEETSCPATATFSSGELLVIGDLFIAQSHEITAGLEDRARAAGTLEAGGHFRDKSSSTDNALALGGFSIADQYTQGQEDGAVKVVVMDGGIADLLGAQCDAATLANCQAIVAAIAAAKDLLSRMAQDGVRDVIWFFYPDPSDSVLRDKVDVLRPFLRDVCGGSSVPCHWVDLRPVFEGHYSDYTQALGTPTDAGADAVAAAIWATLQRSCLVR